MCVGAWLFQVKLCARNGQGLLLSLPRALFGEPSMLYLGASAGVPECLMVKLVRLLVLVPCLKSPVIRLMPLLAFRVEKLKGVVDLADARRRSLQYDVNKELLSLLLV